MGERPNGHIFIIRTHTHARDEEVPAAVSEGDRESKSCTVILLI